jgi:hypothetical protein
MPKFYISFQTAKGVQQDDEGLDVPGFEEARAAAIESARELLADDIHHASKNPMIAVIVTNERGQELARISAKDVLPEPLK